MNMKAQLDFSDLTHGDLAGRIRDAEARLALLQGEYKSRQAAYVDRFCTDLQENYGFHYVTDPSTPFLRQALRKGEVEMGFAINGGMDIALHVYLLVQTGPRQWNKTYGSLAKNADFAMSRTGKIECASLRERLHVHHDTYDADVRRVLNMVDYSNVFAQQLRSKS